MLKEKQRKATEIRKKCLLDLQTYSKNGREKRNKTLFYLDNFSPEKFRETEEKNSKQRKGTVNSDQSFCSIK